MTPTLPDSAGELRQRVEALIRGRLPSTRATHRIPDELSLGAEGIGLDSIAMVELLIECETEFGITIPPGLLDPGSLTVGALVAVVTRQTPRGVPASEPPT